MVLALFTGRNGSRRVGQKKVMPMAVVSTALDHLGEKPEYGALGPDH